MSLWRYGIVDFFRPHWASVHGTGSTSNVFKNFIIAVFVEVVGLPLTVTKSLFPTAKENATEKLLETQFKRFKEAEILSS